MGRTPPNDLAKGYVMKIQSQFGRLVFGLTLSALAVPVAALDQAEEDGTVVNAPRYQERVGFTDLDLRQDDDKRVLISRVKKASGRVCRDMASDHLIEQVERPICKSATYRKTRPQIRRAFARAASGEKLALVLTVGSGN
jgi:UrcA family protein